jgi:type II secretory pathway component GspD/PulD (secretin)
MHFAWSARYADEMMGLSLRRVACIIFMLAVALFATPRNGTARAATAGRDVRVTLQAKNEPVRAVLMRLAHATGANISVADGVSGYVTIELRSVAFGQALHAVLEPLGASFRLRDGIYMVEPVAGSVHAAPNGPVVLPLTIVTAKRAAAMVRPLFPQASVREDGRSNALIVIADPTDVQAIRAVLQGIDVRDPSLAGTEAIVLRSMRAASLANQLSRSFPKAKFAAAGDRQLLVTAAPSDMAQIKAAVNAIDAPLASPPPAVLSTDAIPVTRRAPLEVARALASQVAGLRASVSGSAVVLSGPPDAVARGKALVAQLDLPSFGERYTQVYRIRSLDAGSVADLLRRSFHDIEITVDTSLNAIAVSATAAQHQRIADAIGQLDPPAGSSQTGIGGAAGAAGGGTTDIISLKSFVPGQSQGGPDAVASLTQALQIVAPDVHIVQLPTPGQIALIGPPSSVRIAHEFIDKVDVVAPLVVLDTEVLEVDESVAKNLGLQLGTAVVSSTFTEVQPPPNPDGTQGRIGRLQALTRTPISFTAQLNLLVQNGKGRVLADPRITTLSGRTASIRAGDTISILTTTAGNAGTIATTQVQSFQTGVTLDITPSVTPDGGITVFLHPVVNSLIGTNAGVPEISTRDTQTTVHLQDDETLVIGGLIQENDTRTTTKIPVLGDLPLIGGAFRNDNVQGQRNELIIVVTPHIVKPGKPVLPGPPLSSMPTPAPLPTLPPGAHLPAPSGQLPILQVASNTGTPKPMSTPAAVPRAVSPAPAPSAFAQTNVYTFGSAPQNNFARPNDSVQIFYATLSPTVMSNGTQVRIAAITTTNVSAVKLQVGSQTIGLSQMSPGQWQAAFPFPAGSTPIGQNAQAFPLIASRSDGSSATISIPITAAP